MSKDKRLCKLVENALSGEIESPAEYTFRSSNLPFCGRAWAIDKFLKKRDEEIDKSISHTLQSIFDFGTAGHSSTQKWLGVAGLLFGHWRCANKPTSDQLSEAKKLRDVTKDDWLHRVVTLYLEKPTCGFMINNDYHPLSGKSKIKKCPICGNKYEWEYVEFDLTTDHIGAHTDGYIPKFKAILEIKTTSKKRLSEKEKPDLKHWAYQASVYAHLLRKKGYSVKRLVLVYIERESLTYKVFVRPVMKHVLKSTMKDFKDAKKKVHLKILPNKICPTYNVGHNDINCMYSMLCFSPTLEKQLGIKK